MTQDGKVRLIKIQKNLWKAQFQQVIVVAINLPWNKTCLSRFTLRRGTFYIWSVCDRPRDHVSDANRHENCAFRFLSHIFGYNLVPHQLRPKLGGESDFWSRRACVRHMWWRTKRSWPLFSPTFFFFFFLSSFFSAFYFSPTSGKLQWLKIWFPQYFGITRRYMQKKKNFFR